MEQNEMNGSALAVREPESAALAMVGGPEEAKARLRQLQEFVKDVMVAGTDYGVMPGMKGEKGADGKPQRPNNVLFQPGAQKLTEIYGLAIDFEDAGSTEDFDKPLFFYKKRCVLRRKIDGAFAGAGVGSCNSMETKYAGRWVYEREIPPQLDKSRLASREYPSKNGGTFKKFRVPNEDLFSLVNTIEKMACKRALVMAVIGVTRSAGLFTQDVEDNPEAFGIKAPLESVEQYPDDPEPAAAPKGADLAGIEKRFAEAQSVEDVRRIAIDAEAMRSRMAKGQPAQVRGWRAAAEARIEAATKPAASEGAAPVVEDEMLEPGALG